MDMTKTKEEYEQAAKALNMSAIRYIMTEEYEDSYKPLMRDIWSDTVEMSDFPKTVTDKEILIELQRSKRITKSKLSLRLSTPETETSESEKAFNDFLINLDICLDYYNIERVPETSFEL
jgi:hypothetical protein